MSQGTPKNLHDAVYNGVDEFFSDRMLSKNKEELTKVIQQHIKDYASQTLTVLMMKNQMYGTPEMDSVLESHAMKFDCTFDKKKS